MCFSTYWFYQIPLFTLCIHLRSRTNILNIWILYIIKGYLFGVHCICLSCAWFFHFILQHIAWIYYQFMLDIIELRVGKWVLCLYQLKSSSFSISMNGFSMKKYSFSILLKIYSFLFTCQCVNICIVFWQILFCRGWFLC